MRVLIVVFALLLAPSAWAQSSVATIGGCTALKWDASPEPDLDGYHAYVSKDGATQPRIRIAKDKTSITCVELGIVEGSEYVVGLSAFDTSSNESPIATPPSLTWPDKTPPATVTSVCWDATVIVVDTATGKVISSTPKQICE